MPPTPSVSDSSGSARVLSPRDDLEAAPLSPREAAWLAALMARHTASLRFAEVRRGLTALSTVYVQSRARLAAGAALDGAGKRHAFALYYGSLHFLAVRGLLRQLPELLAPPAPRQIWDLGCGTGVAGAAWSQAAGSVPLRGLDLQAWALAEARWNWQQLGLRGRAQRGQVLAATPAAQDAVVLAYVVNELLEDKRAALLAQLLAAGCRCLVLEPISRRVAPWWDTWVAASRAAGGGAGEARLDLPLPPPILQLGRAAGLRPGLLKVRWLTLPAAPPAALRRTSR